MFKFNLQYFADPAPVNTTTEARIAPEIKEFYVKELLKAFKPNLVHLQFGDKKPMPQGNGKSVEWRKVVPIAKNTTPLTEGVTPEAVEMAFSAIKAELNQFGMWTNYTDVLKFASIDPVVSEYNEALASSGSLTMDAVCRDVLCTTTNVMYCSKKAADGTKTAVTGYTDMDPTCILDIEEVFKAANILKRKNAKKIDDSFIVIAHPDVITALMIANTDNGWIDIQKYSNTTKIYEGEVGKIAGCRFVESSEAKITDRDGKIVYSTLFIGKKAYGVVDPEGMGMQSIIKDLGENGNDPLNQRGSIGWKAMQTTAILNPEYLLKVESMTDIVSGAQPN